MIDTNELRKKSLTLGERALIDEIDRLRRFEFAFNEWIEKTEWVQETATAAELGKHRADAMRDRIAALEHQLASRGGVSLTGVPDGYALSPIECEGQDESCKNCLGVDVSSCAVHKPEGQEAGPERLRLIPLTERMPDPDKHPRVVVYTEGSDFQGEQFFDVDAESLNENYYADPAEQPEVCRYATHWIGANDLACLAKAIARPAPAEGQAGCLDELLDALKMAVLQNSHGMLLSGEELRWCEKAIAAAQQQEGRE